jgi:hypothetical protein
MTPPPAAPSWFEHVDLMQLCLVATLGIIVYFAKRTLVSIDANQKLLFKQHDILRGDHDRLYREFTELRGQHRATHAIRDDK